MGNAGPGAYTLRRLCQEEWPITSLTETGDRIGVTRERVRQLVRKLRIPTSLYNEQPSKKCLWCRKEIRRRTTLCSLCWQWSKRSIIQCDECGVYFARYTKIVNGYPSRRKNPHYRGGNYCSLPCRTSRAIRAMLEARGITWNG